ncbi:hypothetical protein BCR43DRAFT_415124, partial [Syncephalastrum racemosum]
PNRANKENIEFPPLSPASAPTPKGKKSTNAPNYASAARRGATSKSAPRRRGLTQRQIAACVRQFGPVSENHGFKYIYLRLKHRMPTAHLRSTLKKLRIDTSRILDMHFPDRCVAALLVHNDYAEELIAQLSALGIQPHDLFDPLDPAIIRDP